MNLTDKYRPACLADLHGQSWIVHQLEIFLEQPYSAAFLFHGATGTGKTSAALALARQLGVAVNEEELGGLFQIASGEQTAESVRTAMSHLRFKPLVGSGWRVLIVNEADMMSSAAAFVWLDALENLPPQTLVIFTTNNAKKIPARLADRCEAFAFESKLLAIRHDLQAFARRVWIEENGIGECPPVEDFGTLQDDNGDCSFRRLLQLMTPRLRDNVSTVAPAPRPVARARRRNKPWIDAPTGPDPSDADPRPHPAEPAPEPASATDAAPEESPTNSWEAQQIARELLKVMAANQATAREPKPARSTRQIWNLKTRTWQPA
jgi:hypothetical protein